MKFNSKRELYRAAVVDWLNRNNYQATEHIIDVIISVLFTRDSVLIGGGFAKALCDNDLFGVARNADKEVFDNLKIIISAYHNVPALGACGGLSAPKLNRKTNKI